MPACLLFIPFLASLLFLFSSFLLSFSLSYLFFFLNFLLFSSSFFLLSFTLPFFRSLSSPLPSFGSLSPIFSLSLSPSLFPFLPPSSPPSLLCLLIPSFFSSFLLSFLLSFAGPANLEEMKTTVLNSLFRWNMAAVLWGCPVMHIASVSPRLDAEDLDCFL